MLRLNKLTDYSLALMEYVASHPEPGLHTARGIADATHIPQPTVIKILRRLSERGLLKSHRGIKGGYSLTRPPARISLADVIEAMEGPMGFTECATLPGRCELEGRCRVKANFRVIGSVIRQTLGNISLSDLTTLLNMATRMPNRKNIISAITLSSGGVQ